MGRGPSSGPHSRHSPPATGEETASPRAVTALTGRACPLVQQNVVSRRGNAKHSPLPAVLALGAPTRCGDEGGFSEDRQEACHERSGTAATLGTPG